MRDYIPQARPQQEEKAESTVEYGRSKKIVVAKNVAAPTKNRFRVRWGKIARYKFMSHLDNLRMFERAIRRARIPVTYSQGFNPTPKLSYGPPLPLGFTSEAEYVDITLETSLMNYMVDSLKRALPEGISLLDSRVVYSKNASLSAMLNRVRYTIPAEQWCDRGRLEEMISHVLGAENLVIDRPSKDTSRPVDIRSAIYELSLVGDTVTMLLGLGEGGYARPTEVAQFLADGLQIPIAGLSFHRLEMYRLDPDSNRVDPMDL